MIFDEKEFSKIYHKTIDKNDFLTQEIIKEFFEEQSETVEFIKKVNDLLSIPPLLTFVLIKAKQDSGFMETVQNRFQSDKDKQYYGALVGYAFAKYGYVSKEEKIDKKDWQKTNLRNASIFIKSK